MSQAHKINGKEAIQSFMYAGKAIITLLNTTLNTRITFKFKQAKDATNVHFVSVKNGSDNEKSWSFIGTIFNTAAYAHSKKSSLSYDSIAAKTVIFLLDRLKTNTLPVNLEIWHEGRCGCCGRLLTTPESILVGIGPNCARRKKLATDSKPVNVNQLALKLG